MTMEIMKFGRDFRVTRCRRGPFDGRENEESGEGRKETDLSTSFVLESGRRELFLVFSLRRDCAQVAIITAVKPSFAQLSFDLPLVLLNNVRSDGSWFGVMR